MTSTASTPTVADETERARPPTWAGWATLAGIGFVVLYAAGFLISGDTPAYDAPDSEWTAWFDDEGNRALQVVGMLLMAVASMVFIVFLAALVRALRAARAEGRRADLVGVAEAGAPTESVVFGAGIVFAAATAIAAVGINQGSAAITFGGDNYPIPAADVLRQSEQFGFGVGLLVGGWAAALMIAATSVAARQAALLPGWMVIGGYVVAGLLILSVFFLPMLLLVLWVLAISLVLGRRSTTVKRSIR